MLIMNLKKMKYLLKKRGQVLVLYALLIPLLLMFAGLGIDLGWYYLNVSRLQNAADAAVLAGAQALVREGNAFENYYVVSLSSNKLPDDFADYKDVFSNTFDSNTSAGGKLYNYKKSEDLEETLNAGRYLVEQYKRGHERAKSHHVIRRL